LIGSINLASFHTVHHLRIVEGWTFN
jgi:hypothetical protein